VGQGEVALKSKMQGLLALGVTLLLFALLTASASAVGEQITISPTSGPPVTTVTVNGSGWQDHASRGWDVPIQIDGRTLATAHPDANGNFSVQITIPESAAPGSKLRIDALLGNGSSASAWFDVTESGSGTGNGIDLEVTKIDPLGQSICAGSDVTFRAYIRNNGSSESGFFNIRWITDNGQNFDGGHYSIPAGATDTHDHIWKNLSAGKHTLEFIADFDKQKSETNENNNRIVHTFTADDCSPTPKQPPLSLPWSATEGATTWYYSGGPHCDLLVDPGKKCPSNAVRYAVDFMPPGKPGCSRAREESGWVTPAGSGIVRASGNSLVEIDHGNGFRTGYYHLKSDTIQVQIGQKVGVADKLGRPSCEAKRGGKAFGTHVHFYICEEENPDKVCGPSATSSAVRPIDGLIISGWTIRATADRNYDGTMSKGNELRTADDRQCGPGDCGKIRNDLTAAFITAAPERGSRS
jgi:hypothetical protein